MAGAAASPTVVVLGTATPGGGFPLYGGAVADTAANNALAAPDRALIHPGVLRYLGEIGVVG